MKKSKQFWQDVELALNILVLRQNIHHVIVEGRHTRAEINKGFLTIPGHDQIIDRYRILTMVRFRSHNSHLYA